MKRLFFLVTLFCFLVRSGSPENPTGSYESTMMQYPDETHLQNIHQLTFGGDNAEAYFSFDGSVITFQATNPDWKISCDQIYYSTLANFSPTLLSTGSGRTTC